jgi:hypothetical protein
MFLVTKVHLGPNQITSSIYVQVLMEQNLANKILSYVWWSDMLGFETLWGHRKSWPVYVMVEQYRVHIKQLDI